MDILDNEDSKTEKQRKEERKALLRKIKELEGRVASKDKELRQLYERLRQLRPNGNGEPK